jgi:hypothetical protein
MLKRPPDRILDVTASTNSVVWLRQREKFMKRSRSKESSATPSAARFWASRGAGIPRLAVVLSALAVIGFAVAGCNSGSSQNAGSGAGSARSAAAAGGNSQSSGQDGQGSTASGQNMTADGQDDQGTTVSGQVIHGDTGAPYANAIVEFKNLYGGNVHTTTDSDGRYSVELPPDTYTALALDSNDFNEGFNVIGRTDNAVTVPPSTTISFEGSPIS